MIAARDLATSVGLQAHGPAVQWIDTTLQRGYIVCCSSVMQGTRLQGAQTRRQTVPDANNEAWSNLHSKEYGWRRHVSHAERTVRILSQTLD